MIEGSGSISLINGSKSRRSKNIGTDPDPQHWFSGFRYGSISGGFQIKWSPGSWSLSLSKIQKIQRNLKKFINLENLRFVTYLTTYFFQSHNSVQVGFRFGSVINLPPGVGAGTLIQDTKYLVHNTDTGYIRVAAVRKPKSDKIWFNVSVRIRPFCLLLNYYRYLLSRSKKFFHLLKICNIFQVLMEFTNTLEAFAGMTQAVRWGLLKHKLYFIIGTRAV